MAKSLEEFKVYRETMNAKILESENLEIKRFFALDSAAYRAGSLSEKTKEMMGLVASTVLRCNECILYHIDQCAIAGVSSAEFEESMSIALIVGGSITIPHLRYAFEMWEKVQEHGS